MDLSFVEYHVSNSVVDAGGFADVSLRIQAQLSGTATLQPTTSPSTDAYVISAFLTKEKSLNSPAMIKQVECFDRFQSVCNCAWGPKFLI